MNTKQILAVSRLTGIPIMELTKDPAWVDRIERFFKELKGTF